MQLEKASAINWLFVQSGQVSNFLLSDPEVMMSNPFLTSGIPESCNPMSLLVRRPKLFFKKVLRLALFLGQNLRFKFGPVALQIYAWEIPR